MDRERLEGNLGASDPIEEYLDQLRAGLRTRPQEADLIVAEAEDHLRETAAAGLAIGMTEREAQEAAISVFGPVRTVARAHHAHRDWLAAAGEAGLAAWKLAAVLLLTSRVTGLAIATIQTIWPPVVGLPNNGVCWPCLPPQGSANMPPQGSANILWLAWSVNPLWLAWGGTAVGGAILLAGCGLTLRLRLRLRRGRGHGMLLNGYFPMVAAGLFSIIALALALTTLNGGGVSGSAAGPIPVTVPGPFSSLGIPAYLAVAVGYAIRMAWKLRRQRRDQVGTFGRVLSKG
jgi:hypothetical protein